MKDDEEYIDWLYKNLSIYIDNPSAYMYGTSYCDLKRLKKDVACYPYPTGDNKDIIEKYKRCGYDI